MRSPAAAIAWEFRRRHFWGLAALIVYFGVLATIRLLLLAPGQDLAVEPGWRVGLFVVVPLASTFMFFLAVFSFGLAGDLAARQSIYPSRMFTLPVTNAALAGWPMLYGTLAMAVLWMATRLLAVLPPEVDVPWIWPALFAAACLAWTQALTWMPYALSGLRVIVTVLWLTLIGCVVSVAIHIKTPEPVMLALLAPHVPLAYLVARFAVTRARRGDVPDWRELLALLAQVRGFFFARRHVPFMTPADAQAWFEWRRYGRTLPALTAFVVPFELALLFVFRETSSVVFVTLAAVLLTPSFMAAFVAATVRKSSPDANDSHELTPFMAARPLTSVSLITAKLKASVRSTFVSWVLVLVAIPVALELSGDVDDGDGRCTSRERPCGSAPRRRDGTPRACGFGCVLMEAARAKPLHRHERPRMARQSERLRRPGAVDCHRDAGPVGRREPDSDHAVVECGSLDPGRPRRVQNLDRYLDRIAPS